MSEPLHIEDRETVAVILQALIKRKVHIHTGQANIQSSLLYAWQNMNVVIDGISCPQPIYSAKIMGVAGDVCTVSFTPLDVLFIELHYADIPYIVVR